MSFAYILGIYIMSLLYAYIHIGYCSTSGGKGRNACPKGSKPRAGAGCQLMLSYVNADVLAIMLLLYRRRISRASPIGREVG